MAELIEQRLSEAQHRRVQVIEHLNAASDAPHPAASTSRSVSTSNVFGGPDDGGRPLVFDGDDRSVMNLYRRSIMRSAPPLSDVAALRVDDLITSFLRYRRSLHHLAYHGKALHANAADQLSEVGILQARIEKVQFECFVMLEQLRQGAVDCPVETTGPIVISETAEVSALRSGIREEKAKLRAAMQRLEVANHAPSQHTLALMTQANAISVGERTSRPVTMHWVDTDLFARPAPTPSPTPPRR